VPDQKRDWAAMVRYVEGMGEVKIIVQPGAEGAPWPRVWVLRPDNIWDVMMPFTWSDGETVTEMGA
jgi:hypothetical protein